MNNAKTLADYHAALSAQLRKGVEVKISAKRAEIDDLTSRLAHAKDTEGRAAYFEAENCERALNAARGELQNLLADFEELSPSTVEED